MPLPPFYLHGNGVAPPPPLQPSPGRPHPILLMAPPPPSAGGPYAYPPPPPPGMLMIDDDVDSSVDDVDSGC